MTAHGVTPASPTWQPSDAIVRLKGEPTVLSALATGSTIEAAAEAGDVSKRTVYRRMEDPGYRQAIRDHREAALSRAFGVLSASAAEVTAALHELARTAESEQVRLGAMRTALDFAVRLHDHLDVSARFAAIEDEVAALKAERDERARREAAGLTPVAGRMGA